MTNVYLMVNNSATDHVLASGDPNDEISWLTQQGVPLSLSTPCYSFARYANRAKNIKNKPIINEDPKDALLREFQEELVR